MAAIPLLVPADMMLVVSSKDQGPARDQQEKQDKMAKLSIIDPLKQPKPDERADHNGGHASIAGAYERDVDLKTGAGGILIVFLTARLVGRDGSLYGGCQAGCVSI